MIIVYPSKVYIGQTTNVTRRFAYHKNASKTSNSKLYVAIRECGWDACEKKILYKGDYDRTTLDEMEQYYIKLHDSFNTERGLNEVSGGKTGYIASDSLKNKLSIVPRTPVSKESIKRGALKRSGIPRSEETKTKLSLAHTGKKMSKEACGNMSKAQMGNTLRKGCKLTEAQKLGMRGINSKPIGSTEMGKEWISAREAARDMKCSPAKISHMLSGRVSNSLGMYYVKEEL